MQRNLELAQFNPPLWYLDPFTGELAFALPAAIEESGDNLGQLLTVLEFRDEVVLGATNTLAVVQGVGSEALEDEDEDMVFEDGTWFLLLGASSSIFSS